MEVIFALPLLLIPIALPFMAGYMAKRFGRNFWLWFWISIPLPIISCFILACLPDKSGKQEPNDMLDVFKNLN
jgi:MFS family permease